MPVEDKSCHDLLHCSHRPRCLIENVQSLIVRGNNTHGGRPYIYIDTKEIINALVKPLCI